MPQAADRAKMVHIRGGLCPAVDSEKLMVIMMADGIGENERWKKRCSQLPKEYLYSFVRILVVCSKNKW